MNLRDARQIIDSIDSDPDTLALFGQQYQTPDGTTIIPVTKPAGVFAIKDGNPIWAPATDGTRIALLGIACGLVAATCAGIAMVLRPPWPDLHGTVTKRI